MSTNNPSAYDAIVVGVGGAGSAILYNLAKRKLKVLGLEQFEIAHQMGSSHGSSRIIRLAYHEHPSYVRLVKRSFELWKDLEIESNEKLLTMTGCINIGEGTSPVFSGCLSSAREHHIEHTVLTAQEIMSRFPAFRLPKDFMGVLQSEGGFLNPEKCVEAFVNLANKRGAEIKTSEKVKHWKSRGDGFDVETANGSYHGKKLIFSSGAWTAKLVNDLSVPLIPERQVVGWFLPKKVYPFTLGNLPVWILQGDQSRYAPAYGFPISRSSEGFKTGIMHHRGEKVDPDNFQRNSTVEDEMLLRRFLKEYFPLAEGPVLKLQTCLFTNTPDEHFLLDFHPHYDDMMIVSCCSGHGFKFSSVIGEIVAELCVDGKTRHDIALFSFRNKRTQSRLH